MFTKSLYECFKKKRIVDKVKLSKIDILINTKKDLLRKKLLNKEDLTKIEDLDVKINQECENQEYDKLVKVLGSLDTDHGSTNNTNIWKQMKKAFPSKTKPIPTGVINIEGKVITNPVEKKKVTLDHFLHRMRKRPYKEEVKDILQSEEKVFLQRIILAKENKSPPFEMKELEEALNQLKKRKI